MIVLVFRQGLFLGVQSLISWKYGLLMKVLDAQFLYHSIVPMHLSERNPFNGDHVKWCSGYLRGEQMSVHELQRTSTTRFFNLRFCSGSTWCMLGVIFYGKVDIRTCKCWSKSGGKGGKHSTEDEEMSPRPLAYIPPATGTIKKRKWCFNFSYFLKRGPFICPNNLLPSSPRTLTRRG